jgi:hypothetical protein
MAKIGQKGLYTKCGKPLSTPVFGGFGKGNANVVNSVDGVRRLGYCAFRIVALHDGRSFSGKEQ